MLTNRSAVLSKDIAARLETATDAGADLSIIRTVAETGPLGLSAQLGR